MLTAPSRDWSVFQQIFADHWEAFQHAHPRYQTPYYDGLVAKMLACGNPEKIGYIEYRCLHCGQGKHVVAMSCKSSSLNFSRFVAGRSGPTASQILPILLANPKVSFYCTHIWSE
jgi:hypothetical protein